MSVLYISITIVLYLLRCLNQLFKFAPYQCHLIAQMNTAVSVCPDITVMVDWALKTNHPSV